MGSNGTDDNLGLSRGEVRSGKETVLSLLLNAATHVTLNDIALIDNTVDGLNDDTVSWGLVASVQHDDVTNNEVPNVEGLHGAGLATDNWELLVEGAQLESDELGILAVVVECGDEYLDEEGDDDEGSLSPASLGVVDHTKDDAQESEDCSDEKDAVVKGVLQGVLKGWQLWSWLHIFSEH